MTHLSFHSLGLSVEAAYLVGAQNAVEGLSLGMHGLAKTRVEDGGPLFSEIITQAPNDITLYAPQTMTNDSQSS